MNIATLIRYKKGTYEGIWNGNSWFAHGNLIDIARRYGVGMTVIATDGDYEKVCQVCDGLILPGSSINIDPSFYGQAPFDPRNEVEEYLLDSKIIEAFDKMGKPMFGICGGIQALNVYYGGTLGRVSNLKTDAHSESPSSHGAEEQRTDRYGNVIAYKTHPVKVKKGSFIHDVFQSERILTNTYHGYALDRVAEGFEVVATSDDGIVEAVEWKEKKVYGTQWHPELAYRLSDPLELRIFENFLRTCAENAK